MKILVTPTSFTAESSHQAAQMLAGFADEIVFNPKGRPLTPEEVIPLLDGIDGYVAGLDYIDAQALAAAPASLKVISRYGAGYDRVDIEAAGKRSIKVCNTPGANSEAVADMTLGLMLSAGRRIPFLDSQVKAGQWPRFKGTELFGKSLGIVGLGEIGKKVAKRAAGFSMRILAHDPYLDEAYAQANGITGVDMNTLLSESDVISLHSPLTAETQGMIGIKQVRQMKRGVLLVNTARAELCEEKALLAGLEEKIVGGLGLDVFATEPPGDNPLLAYDNVVCTPHAGAHSMDAVERMAEMSVNNLIAVLKGEDCPFVVNHNFMK